MAVTKIQNTKLSSSTATPAPNASSIWIELVAAVKVFEIEERREIAAGHVLARYLNGICGILCDTGFIDWLGHGRCWGGGSMQCALWFEVVTHTRGTPSINGNHMGFG